MQETWFNLQARLNKLEEMMEKVMYVVCYRLSYREDCQNPSSEE